MDSRRFRITNSSQYHHKKMVAENVETYTFEPPHHMLRKDIETKLGELLREYKSQFTQDETTIGTTPLTKITIDTRDSEPVFKNPYPIAMKYYNWVKGEINKLLAAKVIRGNWSSCSAPIIVVPKGDGGKCLVINYCALNKITWKFIWPMLKVEDIFLTTEWHKILLNTTSHWMSHQYQKQPSLHHLENINTSEYPSDSHKHLHIFRSSWQVS